jgi:hypothetical protein
MGQNNHFENKIKFGRLNENHKLKSYDLIVELYIMIKPNYMRYIIIFPKKNKSQIVDKEFLSEGEGNSLRLRLGV